MKLAINHFEAAIAKQATQIGLWISLGSPLVAEVISGADFDWALIDTEHTPNDYMDVLAQLNAFKGTDTTALVRPEWNDPVVIKRLLDLGAQGLIIPMIQSVEEAKNAVAATRYPPKGVRGYAGASRATQFGRVTDYVERVDAETTVILQLESASAIAQAEQIASVDGVSGIFFGPADIAADIGKTGKPMDPAVWDLIRPAAAKLRAMGVPVGTLVLDPVFASDLMNDGFSFVAVGTDAALMARASDALLADVKGRLSKG